MNDKLIFLLVSFGLLLLSHAIVAVGFPFFARLVYKAKTTPGEKALSHFSRSLKWGLFFVIFPFLEPLFSPADWAFIHRLAVFKILFILNLSWILIELTDVLRHYFLEHYSLDKPDNLRERKIYTQISFIRKIAVLVIAIIGLASLLMSFEIAREAGKGLLASAGIAGIIIGLAAQKSIANLLAGFQIAFTQPIRIDDVVVVEGEWGKIEEINLTYVVVCIWDQRRLVLPIYYFLEKPFQNWTRNTADIWGTVFLYVDHTVPVQELKAKLKEILNSTPLWDGKVQVLQVTDVKPTTIELRCLMSAKDSPSAFDLRCLVREKMINFIQEHYSHALPKTRVMMDGQKISPGSEKKEKA